MSKKFEYNFTNQNELIQLRERVFQLQEENNLLKQSLEELIKVNTELTESIQEFNNENIQSDYQVQQINEMQNIIETLNTENQNLKRQAEFANYQKSKTSNKLSSDIVDERETQSLVNVLEELIESFKNMQTHYQSQMEESQKSFQQYKDNYELALKRLEDQYKRKLNTLNPIIDQMDRKEENLRYIVGKIQQLQSNKPELKENKIKNSQNLSNNEKTNQQIRKLETEISEKGKAIKKYQQLLQKLRVKFNEKM